MATMSTGLKNWLLTSGSFTAAFDRGVIELYSGPPPTSADDPHPGVLLGRITTDGLPFVPGQASGGLRFLGIPQAATVTKFFTDSWIASFTDSGTVGSWRLRVNGADDGAQSSRLPRLDGVLGAEFDELFLPQTSVADGDSFPVQLVSITFD